MITKFNQYNYILEKSFLNKLHLNNKLINFLHKHFDLNSKQKLVEIQFNIDVIKNSILNVKNIIICVKNNEYYILSNNKLELNEAKINPYTFSIDDEDEADKKITVSSYTEKQYSEIVKIFSKKIKDLSQNNIKKYEIDEEDLENLFDDEEYEDDDENLFNEKKYYDDETEDEFEDDDEPEEEFEDDDDFEIDFNKSKKYILDNIISKLLDYDKKLKENTLVNVYDKNNKSNQVFLEEFLKDKQDFKYYIVLLNIRKTKSTSLTIEKIMNMFKDTYENIFMKILKKYENYIRTILKRNIDELELKNLTKYILLLNDDLYRINSYINNFKEFYNSLNTFNKQLNINFNDLNENNIDYYIKFMSISIYNTINRNLNFKNEQIMSKILEKNPSMWNEFKSKIYDVELLNKWKYLDNANNFDLI